jgi:hypothetical protein
MALLISFVNLLLYLAVIILVAVVIVWLVQGFMGWTIDPDVMKWGKVVVALLCFIAILMWISGAMGGVGLPLFWRHAEQGSAITAISACAASDMSRLLG